MRLQTAMLTAFRFRLCSRVYKGAVGSGLIGQSTNLTRRPYLFPAWVLDLTSVPARRASITRASALFLTRKSLPRWLAALAAFCALSACVCPMIETSRVGRFLPSEDAARIDRAKTVRKHAIFFLSPAARSCADCCVLLPSSLSLFLFSPRSRRSRRGAPPGNSGTGCYRLQTGWTGRAAD